MPQRKTAVKELKKSRALRLHNLTIKTELRKAIKAFVVAATANPEEAKKLLPNVYKKIDKAAKRNIFKKKTAAHRKSYCAKLLVKKPA